MAHPIRQVRPELLSPKAARLLASLDSADQQILDLLFDVAANSPAPLTVADLWHRRELSLTHVILLISSIDQQPEMELAREVLTWQAFSAQGNARVQCIPSSDFASRLCSQQLGAIDFPSLIISNSPEMHSHVRFGPRLLFSMLEQKGALPRFLTKVHRAFELGASVGDIQAMLDKDAFIDVLKVAFNELKSLVSISVKAG